MFFHLGIPIFVFVINTGHLAASSRPSFGLWHRNAERRSCLASHLAACVGMINVTNHLLTPRGQAFALSPITLLLPAVFSLPLYPVDSLYLAQAVVSPPTLLQIPGNTTMHFTCLQSSVRFQIYLSKNICYLWPLRYIYVVNMIRYSEPEQIRFSALVLTFALCNIAAGF